jgi:hypothetical protein
MNSNSPKVGSPEWLQLGWQYGQILSQGPRLTMRSWSQIQKYLDAHKGEIPEYSIMRWNMSNRGCLVDVDGEALAHTVTLAEEIIKFR